MNYDLQYSDLSTLLAEGRLVADETRRAFGQLSAEQINWKPREGEWSIGQCFDHLIISNRPYLTIIEEVREGKKRQRAWERMPLLPRFFGKLLIRTLRPDSGRKVKARPAFLPLDQPHHPGDHYELRRATAPAPPSYGSDPRVQSGGHHHYVAGGSLHHVQPHGCLSHRCGARAESLRTGDASDGGVWLPTARLVRGFLSGVGPRP